jgi:hypothetical protein
MPTPVFASCGVGDDNLFVVFPREALPAEWSRFQLGTVRWKLCQAAGKVVDHGDRVGLKVRRCRLELFHEIRRRVYAFSLG